MKAQKEEAQTIEEIKSQVFNDLRDFFSRYYEEELGSNKEKKGRFFVLDDENPAEMIDKTLIVRFQYRELTPEKVKEYDVEGESNTAKQEKITKKSYELKGVRDILFGEVKI